MKEDLGDSVFAESNEWGISLSFGDYRYPMDEVFLDYDVVDRLIKFRSKIKDAENNAKGLFKGLK